ncbi:hypothetical protein ABZY20_30590 [Streptomyces sp. NPDC006624]|uniref:hypothetical protein n=1 Tax=Streptomyces sp. NPDC006624 TaxID=3154892 RepID=UPI00339EE9FD
MNDFRPTDAALAGLRLDPHARHVPAWMYVQRAGDGTVSFVGSSRVSEPGGHVRDADHPLHYGSARTHQLIVGELVVRPHFIVGTDVLRGQGLGGIAALGGHDLARYLGCGDVVLDPYGKLPL